MRERALTHEQKMQLLGTVDHEYQQTHSEQIRLVHSYAVKKR